MTAQQRVMAYAGIITTFLLIGAVWSFADMLAARRDAHRAAEDLAHVRALATDIRELRREPAVAAAEVLGTQRLGEQIESAARQANFPTPPRGVSPQSPRRVGDTPYLRQPTEIDFQGVSLPGILPFFYYLTEDSGLDVSALRLRTPPGRDDTRLWDVQATLTYLIYAPQDTPAN